MYNFVLCNTKVIYMPYATFIQLPNCFMDIYLGFVFEIFFNIHHKTSTNDLTR